MAKQATVAAFSDGIQMTITRKEIGPNGEFLHCSGCNSTDIIKIDVSVINMYPRLFLYCVNCHCASLGGEGNLEFIHEETDPKAYPQCHADGCKVRIGSGLYCQDEKCETRMIFTDYRGSIRGPLK